MEFVKRIVTSFKFSDTLFFCFLPSYFQTWFTVRNRYKCPVKSKIDLSGESKNILYSLVCT